MNVLFTDEQLVQKGCMTKAPWNMTDAERRQYEDQNQLEIRERLFAIGQPLVYEKDGRMVAEHSDGRIAQIR